MIGSLASVTIGLLLGALLTFEGGRAGELQRALAVSLILTLQRWSTLKAQYDVLGQLVAMVPGRSRRVFPPKVPGNSVQFSVARTILAAGLLGSAGGWALANAIHFFLLPSWLLALVAAVGTAYASRRDDRQGDLIRCTSMKCVGAAELIFKSACETRVPSKAASVAGQLGVFVAAVDKKYEVGSAGHMIATESRDLTSSFALVGAKKGWRRTKLGDLTLFLGGHGGRSRGR